MFKRLKSLFTKRNTAYKKKEAAKAIKLPESVLSDDFCLCCSSGINCSKTAKKSNNNY